MTTPADGAGGYLVRPDDLADAAQGVESVLAELSRLELGDAGRAEAGRGTTGLAVRAGPIGHRALGESLAAFCTRWEWGVRAAMRTGLAMAEDLSATADAYQLGERHPAGLFGRILSAATGDPRGRPAPGASLDQIAVDGVRPEPLDEWQRTGTAVADTWAATVHDIGENSAPSMIARTLLGENAVPGQLDDIAGLHEIVD